VKLNRLRFFIGLLLVVGLSFGYVWTQDQPTRGISIEEIPMSDDVEIATLGAGCFWCVEAVFQDVKGVHKVESGYTGGQVENPTYKQICTGTTGHAEVAQITFDPSVISFEDVLMIFWHTHDPTTLNRQGNDAGTQYRSAIFYHNEKQKEVAEKSKAETEASDLWPNPIVTEITPLDVYYPAEDYHQNYFNNNPYQPYCMMVVNPKVQKFRKSFGEWLKKE
jgi:peptide-methionine (S)-S-oxide reductase